MNDSIILISKDVLRADYLEPYGQKYWKTPNILELAKNGTVFKRHYTAAPSSAMSYTAMFSGLFSHEMNRKQYSKVKPFEQTETLFSILEQKGYACHVIWDESWFKTSYLYSMVYGKNTQFHNIPIAQHVGPHRKDSIKISDTVAENTLKLILEHVRSSMTKQPVFIWLHLPHVLKGRASYGSDIDLFDKIIGQIRKLSQDTSIYISSDHGHMNIEKNIPVYGFHLYEGAIKIPLITPRINNLEYVEYPTSNIQLKDIILNNSLKKLEYIYSDTQYFLQENRKLAIIKNNYKYIFNKRNKTEELYDIIFDPLENVNLLMNEYYDRNRFQKYKLDQIYFYPNWHEVKKIYLELRSVKETMWKQGNLFVESIYKLNRIRKIGFFKKFKNNFLSGSQTGTQESKIKSPYYEI
jgi:hypothetical protein